MQMAQWVLDADDALLVELVKLRHYGVTRQNLVPMATPELTAIGRLRGFNGQPHKIALGALGEALTRLPREGETYAAEVYFGFARLAGTADDNKPAARRVWVARYWAYESISVFRSPIGHERVLLNDVLTALRTNVKKQASPNTRLRQNPSRPERGQNIPDFRQIRKWSSDLNLRMRCSKFDRELDQFLAVVELEMPSKDI